MKPLIITSGEPAGIGPELCAHLVQINTDTPCVIAGDMALLAARSRPFFPDLQWRPYSPGALPTPGTLDVLHIPLCTHSTPGKLAVENSPYVLALLDAAIEGCQNGQFSGVVTAPVHKGVICQTGTHFFGHTEYLAERTGTKHVVMMLVGGGMRVALVTTHLPLAQVSAAIAPAWLTQTIEILHQDLQHRFHRPNPRILVAGLNPHAGESGHMGQEEIDVIIPVLNHLRQQGMALIGPLPADTLFTPHHLETADAVLAMYHDQGLPVLKYASFGGGVNVTLGLPIIRTSVDHGTALDLAGSGRADPGSLFAAVALAAEMAAH